MTASLLDGGADPPLPAPDAVEPQLRSVRPSVSAFELAGERFWAAAANDFLLGLRLCIPVPLPTSATSAASAASERARFSGDPRTLALAVALSLGVAAAVDYALASQDHDALTFNIWGLYATVTWLFAATAWLFLLAMGNASLHRLAALLTAVLVVEAARVAATPLAAWLTAEATVALPALASSASDVAATAVVFYFTVATMRAVHLNLEVDGAKRLGAAFAGGAVLWATSHFLPDNRLFRADAAARPPPLDIEAAYVQQDELVRMALGRVLPSRPGVVDTYFVGFAPFSAEDVFANEVGHAEALFRSRLDGEGRTALLVNSRATLDSLPLANGHNLGAVLRGIGAKMDAEDVLFLHMTSHGSAQHEFSVSFENLGLKDLSAAEIGRIVDSAQLPWRIVVVSACYSGGYIDALMSPTTLVMTASSAENVSFGCEHGREFTYFGEALYQDKPARDKLADGDYQGAFRTAAATVAAREEEEGLAPSEPQISVGTDIAAKLAAG